MKTWIWEKNEGVEQTFVDENGSLLFSLQQWAWENTIDENMNLIAAAPDLLQACKGAIAALTQNKTFPADIEAARQMLSFAIDKAEGKD